MPLRLSRMIFAVLALTLVIGSFEKAFGEPLYPEYIKLQCPAGLNEVGTGTYRQFGFRIYEATLWAPSNQWDPKKPFLLELHYLRDVSKETLVENVIDDMSDQELADEETLARWKGIFESFLPAVKKGDVLSGLSLPGQKVQLFFNGNKLVVIDDPELGQAFFNMWFGKNADKDLKKDLLGKLYQ